MAQTAPKADQHGEPVELRNNGGSFTGATGAAGLAFWPAWFLPPPLSTVGFAIFFNFPFQSVQIRLSAPGRKEPVVDTEKTVFVQSKVTAGQTLFHLLRHGRRRSQYCWPSWKSACDRQPASRPPRRIVQMEHHHRNSGHAIAGAERCQSRRHRRLRTPPRRKIPV